MHEICLSKEYLTDHTNPPEDLAPYFDSLVIGSECALDVNKIIDIAELALRSAFFASYLYLDKRTESDRAYLQAGLTGLSEQNIYFSIFAEHTPMTYLTSDDVLRACLV